MSYKIPIFEAVLNDKEEFEGISCISIVDFPAMEKEMLVFNKDKKPVMFAVQDELQHKITSVVIRCNYPIYRINERGEEYYIRFGKEVIEQLAEKYSKDGLLNQVSVQHNGQLLEDITMTEFFIKNKEKGIDPKGFEDIEDYSLFATFKVNNEEVWNRIMEGEFGGLSMEVLLDMQPTEEYVEEEYNFLTELLRWLTEDDNYEKKKYSVEKSTIVNAIDKKRAIMVDEGGDKAVKYFPHSIGKKGGKDMVVLYNPATKKWKTEELSKMGDTVITKEEITGYDYEDPTYKEIIDDEDITVSRTTHTSTFDELIHNRVMVMISYNDELPDPATGYRQVAIIAHGYTHAGNECIRIMEVFGDSRSAKDGTGMIPDYRLMLTKRIMSLKPMTGTAPWGWDILDDRVSLVGDKSMFPCIDHITEEDLSK